MSLYDFKQAVIGLERAAETAIAREVDLSASTPKNVVFDYEASKAEYYRKSVVKYLEDVKQKSRVLQSILTHGRNAQFVPDIMNIVDELRLDDLPKLQEHCKRMLLLLDNVTAPALERITKTPVKLPIDVKGEIIADLYEIDKAFHAGCYRSVTILCGRILEAALHRKYYEATGVDALEKTPGIGLGNLIGKLNEKGVMMDPALKQQVHLINQVRIFSVHTKQDPFHPNETQARAIVLYTNDVLERLF